jgi:hypothetical protein
MYEAKKNEHANQRKLVLALAESLRNRGAVKRVRLEETHISWVLLAGRYAYKIKKAVDLGFLNFSSLEDRRYYCEEEIRLNRRLAPKIYLDVVSIGGSLDRPVLGGQPAVEYAVRMRRFPVTKQLDRLAASNRLLPQHIDRLAVTIAEFHNSLAGADKHSSFGTAEAVGMAAEQNFEQLQRLLPAQAELDSLFVLRHASDNEYAVCRPLFGERLVQGFVRECHGDLHLGNIVLIGDQPTPFDGIEFNPSLRWIDVISEVAFTMMDLMYHRRGDLSYRFLDAYFEITGDYAGIRLLRFYRAYRAMVRAKVNAIRAAQPGLPPREVTAARTACHAYLALAERCFVRSRPALIITHGLPGSGKSTFAQIALERLQAIRLRSDVERKRLYGLGPLADSRKSTGVDLYSAEATRRTYARLCGLARELLQGGNRVIVDAAFVTLKERELFRQLAAELSVPLVIASIYAGKDTLRQRIIQRQRAANDASEADEAVLEKLQYEQQPLSLREQDIAASFVNEGIGLTEDKAGWVRLYQLLGSTISEVPGQT